VKIVGKITRGATPTPLPVNVRRTARIAFQRACYLAKLSVYADTLGSAAGEQALRAVVYATTGGGLVAAGTDVSVPGGQTARWMDFTFPEPVLVQAASYDVGIQGGPDSNIFRTYGDTGGTSATEVTDTFADGAAASFGSGAAAARDMSIFATWFSPWVAPEVEEMVLARLPFELAQRTFSVSQRVASYNGSLDWHGTKLDAERGSFCVVHSDRALAGLLGRRVRIVSRSHPDRFVYAFVHSESSRLLEDLSVTRRLYEELETLGITPTAVRVEALT
jgi:hypothetical protein